MKALEELAQLFETMTATAASETQAVVFQYCLDATRAKIAEGENTTPRSILWAEDGA